ncbi:MAG: biopolymer transporter ExbD [Kiritimatiellia bacterium]
MSVKIEELNMTPMIDVVFQLMIYFVLTFEIPQAFTNLNVYRPAGTSAGNGPPPSIRIVVAHGSYSFNETRTDYEGIKNALIQLGDIDPNQNVVIQCTLDSVQQELVYVLDICTTIGLKRLSVLTIGE